MLRESHRPGIEPATCRPKSQVQRRTAESPRTCTPGSAPGPTLGNEYVKPLPFTRELIEVIVRVQVDTRKKEAMESWRPMVTINDDRRRPMSTYRFDGLKPRAHYEVEMSVENHLGKSERSMFVFSTSEGLLKINKTTTFLLS